MKRLIFYIGCMLGILLTSCGDEDLVQNSGANGKEVWATLRFGHQSFDKIDISTRATLNEIAESKVENMFVYVFDASGALLYSHFYEYADRVDNFPTTANNCWKVTNRTSSNNKATEGEVMIKSPTMQGGSIYMIANLNADQLNISSAQLRTVKNLRGLKDLNISLNQEITSRTGLFLMSGYEEGVTITDKGQVIKNGKTVDVSLVRLDAKVTVNVKIGHSEDSNQEMKGFVPESWQVKRLPKGTYLMPEVVNGKIKDADGLGYFDSSEQYFESTKNGVSSFSFYMLENMEDTNGLTSYHQRDLRSKNDDGTYNTDNGLWANASEDATYLVIKGKVQMLVNDVTIGQQFLEADVTYYVHLGNFGARKENGNLDFDNFTIERNTHYTYTITIKGVSSIQTEVEKGEENQPGAVGEVYKSEEEIYTFDSHYGQRVFRMDANSVLDEGITWYVKTPFSEGMPGGDSGLDYKWVWFLVNNINKKDGTYSSNNRAYPGDAKKNLAVGKADKLMNVVEFTQFLTEEKAKWNAAKDNPQQQATASVFRKDANGVYCLYVTVFVDEYYYETNPIDPQNAPPSWRSFVNKPNRLMHILSNRRVSNDGESSLIGSVITIRQRSIQTPYNINKESLNSAWGCEAVDEFADSQLFFYNKNETMTSSAGGSLTNVGTVSQKNGLYNTARMWGLVTSSNVYNQNVQWNTYFDYDRPNDHTTTVNEVVVPTYFLKNDYLTLRYGTLMRNRDNNGNGKIDPDEIRWYVASIYQLYDLYMGELGMSGDVALHSPAIAERADYTKGPYRGAKGWRSHVISSSWGADSQPVVLWAEEGISVSPYATRHGKPAPYSIRCVRNLGLANPTASSIVVEGQAGVGYPTELISVEKTAEGNYRFDLTNINEKSIRYYTSRELEMGDEKSEMAKVYYGFETGGLTVYPTTDQGGNNNVNNFKALKAALESGVSISDEGYRIPNVREGALMSLYCDETFWNQGGYIMVNSWYSNGDYGNGFDAGFTSWQFYHRVATIGNSGNRQIRMIKDWDPRQ